VRLIGGAGEVAPVTPAVMIDEIIPGYVGKAKGLHNLKFYKRFFILINIFLMDRNCGCSIRARFS
jgi:hypothetical protein